jgi:hypothetical protein
MLRLHVGSFGCDSDWINPREAALPRLPPSAPDDAAAGMEEILIALCEPGDAVVTLRAFHRRHADHLSAAGFDARLECVPLHSQAPVCRALLDVVGTPWMDRLAARTIEPWAVTEDCEALCTALGAASSLPHMSAVRAANSKVWSTRLRDLLSIPNFARIVESTAELKEAVQSIGVPVVIKQEHGVSGAGSRVVRSSGELDRLVGWLEGCERRCLSVNLIVEPLFDRAVDFSAQLDVGRDGTVNVSSMQGMRNAGLTYEASVPLRDEELSLIERHGYLELVMTIGGALSKAAYFGRACVDSFITSKGTLVPLVEINARKSMGFINERLDAHLYPYGQRSWLTGVRVSASSAAGADDLLRRMRDRSLLWEPDCKQGVIVLGARSLPSAGEKANGTTRLGRVWLSVPHYDPSEVVEKLRLVGRALSECGYRMVGRP